MAFVIYDTRPLNSCSGCCSMYCTMPSHSLSRRIHGWFFARSTNTVGGAVVFDNRTHSVVVVAVAATVAAKNTTQQRESTQNLQLLDVYIVMTLIIHFFSLLFGLSLSPLQ